MEFRIKHVEGIGYIPQRSSVSRTWWFGKEKKSWYTILEFLPLDFMLLTEDSYQDAFHNREKALDVIERYKATLKEFQTVDYEEV